ncbi:dopamine receptor D4b [Poecilia reticulata]|uniref:dopamine receptor D4b n=1 Tax=Poecilia reticulata TaxID=8081 RepID=UPI0004A334EC|nr:PREDICTED: D(4) dopamine receptor-like [Poecilia reticulata]
MADNFSDLINESLPAAPVAHYNFPALIFGILLIITVTAGNVLVCLSVYLEKALKTTTNYFIVSLAFADLLLAVLVLPLFVYAEVRWFLREEKQKLFSFFLFVIFGINNVPNRNPRECKLEDNNYVVYSSVCSFFIPCPIMVLLYFGVFRGLRRWEEARKAKLRSSIEACRKLQQSSAVGGALPPMMGTIPGALPMPLPRIIERDLAQSRMDDSGDYVQQEIPYPREYRENSVPTVRFNQQQVKKRAKINSRERKAMRVLPVVVGCFLLCWTPFFVVHTMRALCLTCNIPDALMSTVTWLGYVNSALNPIIYTMFNTEFKKFFKKCFRSCC